MKSKGARISRRSALSAVASTGLAGLIGSDASQAEGETDVTPEDIAGSDRVAGRVHTEAQRKQMAPSLTDIRKSLRLVRNASLGPLDDPAFAFSALIPGVEPPKGRSSLRLSKAPVPEAPASVEELAYASVTALARLLKARRITSMALTRMYLERLRKYSPRLLCTVTITESLALAQAERADREIAAGRYRGPLHGIPWGAKDLLATRGVRTTWGAPPFVDQVFDYDATVVQRLERAGAVLCAKLTLGELAMGDVWFGGVTRNPWDSRRGSSGSSAGSAAAVAAGLVAFAIGTETLGSIISPCTVCGTTGFRPTFGRVSRHGAMPLSWTMDKIGPMARAVEDCAVVFAAIHGADGLDGTALDAPFAWDGDAGLTALRVGFDADALSEVARGSEEERKAAYREALAVLERNGARLTPVKLPAFSDAFQALAGLIIDVEGAAAFQGLNSAGGFDQLVQQRAESWPNTLRAGSTIPASDYVQAMRLRRALQKEMRAALDAVDVYVTVPLTGPTIYYTNLAGHPSVITRCGMANGRPVMLEFIGRPFGDDLALRAAHAFERATHHHSLWPDPARLPEVPPPLTADKNTP